MNIANTLNVSLDLLCETKVNIETWADAEAHIVYLFNELHKTGYVCLKRIEGDTTAMIFPGWVVDESDRYEDGGRIVFYDTNPPWNDGEDGYNAIAGFVSDFMKMNALLSKGSIDNDLFNLWLERAYQKSDEPISQILPTFAFDDEKPQNA